MTIFRAQATEREDQRKRNPPASYSEALIALDEANKVIATLLYEANSDPLTGLLNRRGLEHATTLENNRLQTRQTVSGVAIAIDMIGLKRINDTLSHEAGDEAIRVFGEVLKNTLRTTDWIARLGGDEFVILMRNCTLEEATPRIEQLNRNIRKIGFNYNNTTHTVGARMGIAEYDANLLVERALHIADKRQLVVHKHLTPDALKRDYKPT